MFLKFSLLFCLFMTGCATVSRSGPPLIPVEQPTQQIEFPGFTLLPPRGENWFIVPPHPSGTSNITFIKKIKGGVTSTQPVRTFSSLPLVAALSGNLRTDPGSLQTIVAAVTTVDMKEKKFSSPKSFLKAVQETFYPKTDSSPYHRHIESDLRLDASLGEYCVKYKMIFEEHVPQYPDNKFVTLVHGYRCLHPHWPRFSIAIAVTQRYRPDLGRVFVEEEVKPLLSGLKFNAVKPIPMISAPVGSRH